MSCVPPEKSKKKIYRALKSLFRYSTFKNAQTDVLIDCESKILEQALSALTVDDIYYVVENWTDFYIEQARESAVDNVVISQEIENKDDQDKHLN